MEKATIQEFIEKNLDNAVVLAYLAYCYSIFLSEQLYAENKMSGFIMQHSVVGGSVEITVDDFEGKEKLLLGVLVSLKAISLNSKLYGFYCKDKYLLFNEETLENIGQSPLISEMSFLFQDKEMKRLFGLLLVSCSGEKINANLLRLHYPITWKTVLESLVEKKTTTNEEVLSEQQIISNVITLSNSYALEKFVNVEELTIPAEFKAIGGCAFVGVEGLKKVVIPESVCNIGDTAFGMCSKLVDVTIEGKDVEFGLYPFVQCDRLKHIYVPEESIENYKQQLPDWSGLILAKPNQQVAEAEPIYREEGNCVYEDGCLKRANHDIVYCEVKDGTKSIQPMAFKGRNKLVSVVIADSVESIQIFAFKDCQNLKSVRLSRNLKSIQNQAFAGCTSLKSLWLPDSVESLGGNLFLGSGLKKLYLSKETYDRFSDYFSERNYELVFLDNEATKVAPKVEEPVKSQFVDLGVLDEAAENKKVIYLKKKVAYAKIDIKCCSIQEGTSGIDKSAFANCVQLQSVKLPKSVKTISKEAFRNCKMLSQIALNVGLKEIGANAFQDCKSLAHISIPDTVGFIGRNAFEGCDNLGAIYMSSSSYSRLKIALGNKAYKVVVQ